MRLARNYGVELALVLTLALAVAFFGYLALGLLPNNVVNESFDGARALADVERQLDFGPRPIGSDSGRATSDWLIQQLTGLGWDVVVQEPPADIPLRWRNVVAVRSPQNPAADVAMVVTHYDSRLIADGETDEATRSLPPPGANNGASGTAVLLELARTLDVEAGGNVVCLGFLDGEANAGLDEAAPFVGSSELARALARGADDALLRCASPRVLVALDQVGAPEARFQPDPAGEPWVNASLWATAATLGLGNTFVAELAAAPLAGSHTAFADAGFATALIADRTAPNTGLMADTAETLSAAMLGQVGAVLEGWLEAGAPQPDAAAIQGEPAQGQPELGQPSLGRPVQEASPAP
ncbi:MAG: M28 family peptidase, partial [Caldilineaceae bacterium]